ncbi:hypothetical protein ACJ8ME_08165 [Bifidobacterium bifidum]|uniref:hypothetical protein n=1 Tax=Bifidobacterium bifidum TaxID=1681 RepID=UPI003B994248
MEFVIGAVIIIAAVAIAIWAATSHQGGAGAAPDASASATSPSRRDADGKVVSRTSSRDGDTGIATTVVTLKDGTTTVTRTMPDDSSTSTTTAGGLGAGSLQELAASVQAEYLSQLGSYTLGPGAHEDSRREMFDGQWRDKLDRAANNYNVYLPSGFRQFDFCVNRAIDDYMRVGRPYGTPSAYTYRYSERTTSSFNPTPCAFVFDMCSFGTPVPQWDADMAALRQAVASTGERDVTERDDGNHHIILVDGSVGDATRNILYRAFAQCARA